MQKLCNLVFQRTYVLFHRIHIPLHIVAHVFKQGGAFLRVELALGLGGFFMNGVICTIFLSECATQVGAASAQELRCCAANFLCPHQGRRC